MFQILSIRNLPVLLLRAERVAIFFKLMVVEKT